MRNPDSRDLFDEQKEGPGGGLDDTTPNLFGEKGKAAPQGQPRARKPAPRAPLFDQDAPAHDTPPQTPPQKELFGADTPAQQRPQSSGTGAARSPAREAPRSAQGRGAAPAEAPSPQNSGGLFSQERAARTSGANSVQAARPAGGKPPATPSPKTGRGRGNGAQQRPSPPARQTAPHPKERLFDEAPDAPLAKTSASQRAGQAPDGMFLAGAAAQGAQRPGKAAPRTAAPDTDAQRRQNAQRKKAAEARKRQHLQLNIAIGALAGLLIITLLLGALVPGCVQQEPLSGASSLSGSGSLGTESDYNKDAHSLPITELVGTILPETEDAGMEYVRETLFIGDSNTERMIGYRDITGVTLDNAIGVVGMGIGSVTSLPCVKFVGYNSLVTVPQAVAVMQPRRIVMTYGTNDAGGASAESFIKNYRAALEAVHDAYEYADIIIAAVPPIAQKHINQSLSMTHIDKYNVELAKLAEELGYKFLNWTEELKDTNTGFAKAGYMLETDGIHISRNGAQAMFDYFRTHSYITEDTRPKPLAPIPNRAEVQSPLITSDPKATSRSAVSTVSSSAPSAVPNVVTVVYTATSGCIISSPGTTQVEIGSMVPSATANENYGYRFVGWSCSVGSIPNPASTVLSGLVVPSSVTPGSTITVMANYEKVAAEPETPTVASSSAPLQYSSSESAGGNVGGEEGNSNTGEVPTSNAGGEEGSERG